MTIDEITDTTAQLSWRPGPDNHSPITMYVIQARTPFSVGWQAVNTGTILDAWLRDIGNSAYWTQHCGKEHLSSHSDTTTNDILWQCFLNLGPLYYY